MPRNRKAKPLRMWIVKFPDKKFWWATISKRRKDALLPGWNEWANLGYRAVRVTVREEVK